MQMARVSSSKVESQDTGSDAFFTIMSFIRHPGSLWVARYGIY
jgi:hypothetical protein